MLIILKKPLAIFGYIGRFKIRVKAKNFFKQKKKFKAELGLYLKLEIFLGN